MTEVTTKSAMNDAIEAWFMWSRHISQPKPYHLETAQRLITLGHLYGCPMVFARQRLPHIVAQLAKRNAPPNLSGTKPHG